MELLFTSSYFRQVIVNNLILDGFTLYYQIDIQNLDAHRKGSAAAATRATGQKHLKPEKAYTKLASSVMLIYCTATINHKAQEYLQNGLYVCYMDKSNNLHSG